MVLAAGETIQCLINRGCQVTTPVKEEKPRYA